MSSLIIPGRASELVQAPPVCLDASYEQRCGERAWAQAPLVDRRMMLRCAALLPSLVGGLPGGAAAGGDFWSRPRWVWLKRQDTGEELRRVYWANGQLVQSGYDEIVWLLRDVRMQKLMESLRRRGRAVPQDYHCAFGMSLVLLDILYGYGGWLESFGVARPIWITSAFRHDVTNAKTEGASLHSRHRIGGAVDKFIHGVRVEDDAKYALWLRGGGVGIYPGRGFTHVDDGRLKVWRS